MVACTHLGSNEVSERQMFSFRWLSTVNKQPAFNSARCISFTHRYLTVSHTWQENPPDQSSQSHLHCLKWGCVSTSTSGLFCRSLVSMKCVLSRDLANDRLCHKQLKEVRGRGKGVFLQICPAHEPQKAEVSTLF